MNFTDLEMKEIVQDAHTFLAEQAERPYSESHIAFLQWLDETFGGMQPAMRIVSYYTLAKLWAQMHRSAETPLWRWALDRMMREYADEFADPAAPYHREAA